MDHPSGDPSKTQPQMPRPNLEAPLRGKAEPSPRDTAEYTLEEIQSRLEMGRLQVMATEGGSRLQITHVAAPALERRHEDRSAPEAGERRSFSPMAIPTLFPEQGPILLLVVGGPADEVTLRAPAPFWHDDNGGALIWVALAKAGLIHRKDAAAFALGQGGFWELDPPRTQGVAMTYAGFSRRGEVVDFDAMIKAWNQNRLQTLVLEATARSMGRLKVVTLGEAARFMMSAIMYGMEGVPILSLPEPSRDRLSKVNVGHQTSEEYWVDWASDLFAVGRS
ncbi:MAG TPA: hypothetical protein VJ505_07890 [Holophagaceae bacterium]|nr:hypothetical protein [Holophagaceae bacterium]